VSTILLHTNLKFSAPKKISNILYCLYPRANSIFYFSGLISLTYTQT